MWIYGRESQSDCPKAGHISWAWLFLPALCMELKVFKQLSVSVGKFFVAEYDASIENIA